MLIATLLILITLAAAGRIPVSAPWFPDGSCTFTLWQRQQASVDYIQLNTIRDHANNITVYVAAQRPATGLNSYTRLDDNHAFAVTGLLDRRNLTITHIGDDELGFTIGQAKWSTRSFWRMQDDSGKWNRAACNAWAWEGSAASKVRYTNLGEDRL
jgi:hypothetical protein